MDGRVEFLLGRPNASYGQLVVNSLSSIHSLRLRGKGDAAETRWPVLLCYDIGLCYVMIMIRFAFSKMACFQWGEGGGGDGGLKKGSCRFRAYVAVRFSRYTSTDSHTHMSRWWMAPTPWGWLVLEKTAPPVVAELALIVARVSPGDSEGFGPGEGLEGRNTCHQRASAVRGYIL